MPDSTPNGLSKQDTILAEKLVAANKQKEADLIVQKQAENTLAVLRSQNKNHTEADIKEALGIVDAPTNKVTDYGTKAGDDEFTINSDTTQEELNTLRDTNQGFWEVTGNAVAGALAMTLPKLGEQVYGFAIDQEDFNNKSNDFWKERLELMREVSDDISNYYEIHGAEAENGAFTNGEWIAKNLVQQGGAFLLSAGILGYATGGALSGLTATTSSLLRSTAAGLINAGRTAAITGESSALFDAGLNLSKLIPTIKRNMEGAKQLATAYQLTNFEGSLISYDVASDVYKEKYKEYFVNKGFISENDDPTKMNLPAELKKAANNYANPIASNAGSTAYDINKFNMIFNMTGAKYFVKGANSTSKAIQHSLLKNLGKVGLEAAEEGAEELTGGVAEVLAKRQAKQNLTSENGGGALGTHTGLGNDIFNHIFSKEGAEEFFSGVAMGAVFGGIGEGKGVISGEFKEDNIKYKTQQNQLADNNTLKEIYDNNGELDSKSKVIKMITDLGNLANAQNTLFPEISEAYLTDNEVKADALRAKLLQYQAYQYFEEGLGDTLTNTFDLLAEDKVNAEKTFGKNYQSRIAEAKKLVKEAQDVYDTYSSEVSPELQHVAYQNVLNRDNLIKAINTTKEDLSKARVKHIQVLAALTADPLTINEIGDNVSVLAKTEMAKQAYENSNPLTIQEVQKHEKRGIELSEQLAKNLEQYSDITSGKYQNDIIEAKKEVVKKTEQAKNQEIKKVESANAALNNKAQGLVNTTNDIEAVNNKLDEEIAKANRAGDVVKAEELTTQKEQVVAKVTELVDKKNTSTSGKSREEIDAKYKPLLDQVKVGAESEDFEEFSRLKKEMILELKNLEKTSPEPKVKTPEPIKEQTVVVPELKLVHIPSKIAAPTVKSFNEVHSGEAYNKGSEELGKDLSDEQKDIANNILDNGPDSIQAGTELNVSPIEFQVARADIERRRRNIYTPAILIKKRNPTGDNIILQGGEKELANAKIEKRIVKGIEAGKTKNEIMESVLDTVYSFTFQEVETLRNYINERINNNTNQNFGDFSEDTNAELNTLKNNTERVYQFSTEDGRVVGYLHKPEYINESRLAESQHENIESQKAELQAVWDKLNEHFNGPNPLPFLATTVTNKTAGFINQGSDSKLIAKDILTDTNTAIIAIQAEGKISIANQDIEEYLRVNLGGVISADDLKRMKAMSPNTHLILVPTSVRVGSKVQYSYAFLNQTSLEENPEINKAVTDILTKYLNETPLSPDEKAFIVNVLSVDTELTTSKTGKPKVKIGGGEAVTIEQLNNLIMLNSKVRVQMPFGFTHDSKISLVGVNVSVKELVGSSFKTNLLAYDLNTGEKGYTHNPILSFGEIDAAKLNPIVSQGEPIQINDTNNSIDLDNVADIEMLLSPIENTKIVSSVEKLMNLGAETDKKKFNILKRQQITKVLRNLIFTIASKKSNISVKDILRDAKQACENKMKFFEASVEKGETKNQEYVDNFKFLLDNYKSFSREAVKMLKEMGYVVNKTSSKLETNAIEKSDVDKNIINEEVDATTESEKLNDKEGEQTQKFDVLAFSESPYEVSSSYVKMFLETITSGAKGILGGVDLYGGKKIYGELLNAFADKDFTEEEFLNTLTSSVKPHFNDLANKFIALDQHFKNQILISITTTKGNFVGLNNNKVFNSNRNTKDVILRNTIVNALTSSILTEGNDKELNSLTTDGQIIVEFLKSFEERDKKENLSDLSTLHILNLLGLPVTQSQLNMFKGDNETAFTNDLAFDVLATIENALKLNNFKKIELSTSLNNTLIGSELHGRHLENFIIESEGDSIVDVNGKKRFPFGIQHSTAKIWNSLTGIERVIKAKRLANVYFTSANTWLKTIINGGTMPKLIYLDGSYGESFGDLSFKDKLKTRFEFFSKSVPNKTNT